MSKLSRIISIENIDDAEREMLSVGTDPSGIAIMVPKAVFRAVKLKNISVTSANILKQDMLSGGGDAATSYGTIDHSAKTTDVLLFGTLSQYTRLFEKLKLQQFGLPDLAEEIKTAIYASQSIPAPVLGMEFGKRTFVMGILNVTPDSFSDGGEYLSQNNAVERAKEMLAEGADIIDIGGESTRPGAETISVEEEIDRIIPVIQRIIVEAPHAEPQQAEPQQAEPQPIISVDTRKSGVAEAALKAGAFMVNDVSGLTFDPKMAEILAAHNAPVVIMHSKGDPKTMQCDPRYEDLMSELLAFFEERIKTACKAGIKENNIVIDPGIGFGKTLEHNLEILRRVEELRCLGRPICLGTSRKSFIGQILGQKDPLKRDYGTAATISLAISKKVDIIRVHNVRIAGQTAVISDKIIREVSQR
ncbi:MAG: dihydropteroate synthase [Candidatus Margulisiibacteriota bacterium]